MIDAISIFRKFVERRTGVVIPLDRSYLIESRLAHLIKPDLARSLDKLIERIVSGETPELTRNALDAMMTGETLFFRDRTFFASFSEALLPEIIKSRAHRKRLRIWSAACSRGQEAYSIAMLLEDIASQLRGWQIELVASDISASAVEQARSGLFNQFEVQRGLPVTHLLRHFTRDGEQWRISERLRSVIEFRQHNLLEDFSSFGMFDIVFCRNVLMYFDLARRADVLNRILRQTAPDGLIILGGAETSIGMDCQLLPVVQSPGAFQPPQSVASRAVA